MSDGGDARKTILARRAKFVAAALASVTFACNEHSSPPPCLSPLDLPPPDAAQPQPQPCLSVAIEPADAAPPVTDPPDASMPVPMPCLSPMPRPCLSPAVPKKDKR